MGKAGRVRPCRLAEAAHRTPHGKRVAEAKRNGLLTFPYESKDTLLALPGIKTPPCLHLIQINKNILFIHA